MIVNIGLNDKSRYIADRAAPTEKHNYGTELGSRARRGTSRANTERPIAEQMIGF